MARKTGIVRKLTLKERVVLGLSCNGHADPEISQTIGLKENNIRQLRRNALRKLKEE